MDLPAISDESDLDLLEGDIVRNIQVNIRMYDGWDELNHYRKRQITEIQLRYVTINQTLTELFLFILNTAQDALRCTI